MPPPSPSAHRRNSFSADRRLADAIPAAMPAQSPALSTASYKSYDSQHEQSTASSQRVYPISSVIGSGRSSSHQTPSQHAESRRNSSSPTATFGSFSDFGPRPAHSRSMSAASLSGGVGGPSSDPGGRSSLSDQPAPSPPVSDNASSDRANSDQTTTSNRPRRPGVSPTQTASSSRSRSATNHTTTTASDPAKPHAPEGDLDEPLEADIIERTRKLRQTAQREMADAGSRASTAWLMSQEQLMTARFEHASTPDGHMIIVGREGELKSCEEEPIHIPGAVQAWGVLIAVEMIDGRFPVKQVSENSGHLLGLPPSFLFQQECFTDVLAEEEADLFRDAIDAAQEEEMLKESGPHHFDLSGEGIPGSGLDGRDSIAEWACWCVVHRPSPVTRPELYLIEFELQDDPLNPPYTELQELPNEDERTGLAGEPYAPTAEDLFESTVSSAKPLRTMTSTRRPGPRRKRNMNVFQMLNHVTDQLAKADSLHACLKMCVSVIKDLTGYDRVMIYQFDEAWNGQVVAELVDWSRTRDLYRGLHFPSTDIPAQARELYKINRVRLLYDRDQPTARMVCRNRAELDTPLDMSYTTLRAMSPIHIKYLANMGVRASGSISITAFGTLWGLISCHTYGRYGMRVPSPIRQLCRILGESISRNIERLTYAERLNSRKMLNSIPSDKNPNGYLIANASDLLSLFDAEFGILSIGDESKLIGNLENTQEALAVVHYLRDCRFTNIQVSQDITQDYPDLNYPGGFQSIAGLLSVPLSDSGKDFIALFRRGQTRHVHWAGNPYDKILKEHAVGSSDLEPRTSFKMWSEAIVGKAKVWTDDQQETASVLCLVYGKFIEVWRQKETALKTSRLTNLLLSNASHEVRTPLNAIVNYLELALDGSLDGETREALTKSYVASKSLVHVINDLLDLTRIENGQSLFLEDPLDLAATIEQASDIHRSEAQRKGVDFHIQCEDPDSLHRVMGDRVRLAQVLGNIISNAVEHTTSGSVTIRWGEIPAGDMVIPPSASVYQIAVQDTGEGIPSRALDAIFRDFEEVAQTEDNPTEQENVSQNALGLGLAVVARIIRNMGGQLRADSVLGEGSTFTVVLPFVKAPTPAPSPSAASAEQASLLGSDKSQRSLHRTSSMDSGGTKKSYESQASDGSGRSEIDSLVDAMTFSDPNAKNPSASGKMQPPSITRRTSTLQGHASSNYISNDDNGKNRRQDQSKPPTESARSPTTSPRMSPPQSPQQSIRQSRRQSSTPKTDSTGGYHQRGDTASSTSSIGTPSTDSLRVLVVEDDPINRAIIAKKLSKEGHKVSMTVHGGEAVRFFENDREIDLILMDLQMPICDGRTATERIRRLEQDASHDGQGSGRKQHVPIVAVSASLHEDQRSGIIKCGMDGWLLKPLTSERLSAVLAGVRRRDLRSKELYRSGGFHKGGWFVKDFV